MSEKKYVCTCAYTCVDISQPNVCAHHALWSWNQINTSITNEINKYYMHNWISTQIKKKKLYNEINSQTNESINL